MFASKSGGARGQARIAYIVAAVCLGAVIVVPALFGGRAERVYRDSIAQLAGAGHAVRLESYRRGWFSSQATVSVAVAGRGAITLVQHVHHGPLGFYNGWHVGVPGRGGGRYRSAARSCRTVSTRSSARRRSSYRQWSGWAARWTPTSLARRPSAPTRRTSSPPNSAASTRKCISRKTLTQFAATLPPSPPPARSAKPEMAGLTIRGESHRDRSGRVARQRGPQHKPRELQRRRQRRTRLRPAAWCRTSPLRHSPRSRTAGSTFVRRCRSEVSPSGALKLGPISLVAGDRQHPAATDCTIHECGRGDFALDSRPTGAVADASEKNRRRRSLR